MSNQRSNKRIVKRKKLKVKRAIGVFTVFILLLGLIPVISTTLAANATLEVKGTYVNLRKGPGTNYEKIGMVIKGDQLEQLDKQDDWYKIKTNDNKVGWIASWLVNKVEKPLIGEPPISTGYKAIIKGSYVNLRSGPGTNYDKVGKAYQGQEFDFVKSSNDWSLIRLDNGNTVWVASSLVTKKLVPVNNEGSESQTPKNDENTNIYGKGKIKGTYVNLRKEPNTNSAIISKLNKDEQVTIITSDEFNWLNIKTETGKEGWVAGWLVQIIEQPSSGTGSGTGNDSNQSVQKAIITGTYANVRQQPSTTAPITSKVYKGQTFVLLGHSKEWLKLDLGNNEIGWVAGWLAKVEKTETSYKPDSNTPEQPEEPTNGNQNDQDNSGDSDNDQTKDTDKELVEVSGSAVNLRQGPSSEADVIEAVKKGVLLEVIEKQDDWMKVRTFSGKEGWVAAWLVKPGQLPAKIAIDLEAKDKKFLLKITGDKPLTYEMTASKEIPKAFITLRNVELKDENKEIKVNKEGVNKVVVKPSTSEIRTVEVTIFLDTEKQIAIEENDDKTVLSVFVDETKEQKAGKIVVLDAGHGGIDPGAVGPTGLKEKDVVFSVTNQVKTLLEKQGVTVILTRSADDKIPLNQRAEIANEEEADIFVSIHCNASTKRSVKGTSTFIYAPETMPELFAMRDERNLAAKTIQKYLVKEIGTEDLGIKEGNFAVLRNTTIPSVLVETAFISNYDEEKLLASSEFQAKIAAGISEGILNYLDIAKSNLKE